MLLISEDSPAEIRALGMVNFLKDNTRKNSSLHSTIDIQTTFQMHGEYEIETFLRAIFIMLPLYLGFWKNLGSGAQILAMSVFLLKVQTLEENIFGAFDFFD